MLKISYAGLPNGTQRYLDDKQDVIDGVAGFSDKVSDANTKWKNKDSAHFDVIKNELNNICSGARRCHYCEDSAADEVEHIWPKSLYPEFTFVWENYLYACGPCNGSYKRSRFPLLLPNGSVVEPPTGRKAKRFAPPAGVPLFIDPRVDDPMDFFDLDLETGFFSPRHNKGTIEYLRATLTDEIIGLNRDLLKKARVQAFRSYRDSLAQYVHEKQRGAAHDDLKVRSDDLYTRHHPSIWKEMIRSRAMYAQINNYFNQAPELIGE